MSSVYLNYMVFKKETKKAPAVTKEFQQRGFNKPQGFKGGDK